MSPAMDLNKVVFPTPFSPLIQYAPESSSREETAMIKSPEKLFEKFLIFSMDKVGLESKNLPYI
jgi:hypothetical protein